MHEVAVSFEPFLVKRYMMALKTKQKPFNKADEMYFSLKSYRQTGDSPARHLQHK